MGGMETADVATLANLALALKLDPVAAIALPACVTSAARKVEMTELTFVRKCHQIPELGAYVAEACRKVMAAQQ